jgi:membrane-associated protease RseP (regulator of RpoE activity)
LVSQEDGAEGKQGAVEFSFPLLVLRTQRFTRFFDKLGALRFSGIISWLSPFIVPVVAGIGLYMLLGSLLALLWTPAVREIGRTLGPAAYLLIPGISPILPVFYGLLAIIVALTIHEAAHGIIARNLGLRVKSSGLLFLLFIPIGAFVDVDEKQIAKAKPRKSLRIMAAGVGANVVVAIVCILSLLLLVNGLTPRVEGVYVYDVVEGLPADQAGLLANDVFVSADNIQISNYEQLKALLESKIPGDKIYVTVARGEKWENRFSTNITLIESEGRAIMGVNLTELMTREQLSYYQNFSITSLSLYLIPPTLAPSFVPFSDSAAPFYSHWMGDQWYVLANVLFWLWFVNINLAVFNSLPLYPLDGGRMFNISLQSTLGRRVSEKTIYRITIAVTALLAIVILLIFVIPFIL